MGNMAYTPPPQIAFALNRVKHEASIREIEIETQVLWCLVQTLMKHQNTLVIDKVACGK